MRNDLVYKQKAIVNVTKEFTFDSSHHLVNYIGNCARLHGHTYKLQVTYKGTPDDRGIVKDFKELKKVIDDTIIAMLDHQNLNDVLPFNTTAENMCVWIFDVLKSFDVKTTNQVCILTSVKLWETPTSFAEYRGEEV